MKKVFKLRSQMFKISCVFFVAGALKMVLRPDKIKKVQNGSHL